MKLTMRKVLILMSLVPLAVGMMASCVISGIFVKVNLEKQTENTLAVACNALKEYYEFDILSGNEIPKEYTYVDAFTYQGIEMTVFKGDTRYVTSILDKDGNRIEGTKASETVKDIVLTRGQDYYCDDIVINGIDYYGYYMPLKDIYGSNVGMAFAGKQTRSTKEAINNIVVIQFAICIILLILMGIGAYFLSRRISKPVEKVALDIDKIANGNLNVNVKAYAKVYETKQLIGASKALVSNLSDIIGKTKNISSALRSDSNLVSNLSNTSSDGANQIANAMEDLAQGASGMAESIQNINEQVMEMSTAIEGISENANVLSLASVNIQNANKDASDYIGRVSSSSERCVEAVDSIKSQIEETNEAIDKIKEAVEMITSITSQTNLLALNASIEAARAGEAGRGFTVVATEIGSLSDQSDKSAKEIQVIVNQIIEKSQKSVELSQEVSKIITDEQAYINETQNKFELLNGEINSSVNEIDAISKKIQSLESSKNVIVSAVQDFSAITEENAASNQQVSASVMGIVEAISEIAKSSGDTNTKAQELDSTVSFFK